MRAGRVAGALLCALSVQAAALAAPAASKQRPLVYVVVLDGLDGDRVELGGAPFISSLLAGEGGAATYFPRSSSVLPAETNPNHVAMMTGAYPDRSGIPANTFAIYAPLAHPDSCATTGPFDTGLLPTETSGESASCPRAEMAFEAIRRQGNPDRLTTAAIFGKPKLGRIFAGQRFRAGRFDADYLWAPCDDGADDDRYCEDVPTNPISGYASDDATVMDAVIESIENGVPVRGEPRRPSLTFVNLHQIDSAGHATGTGAVYDLAIAQADDQVERLVTTLKERGDWDRTVLVLASDHSMDTTTTKISLTEAFTEAGIAESEFVALNNEASIDFIYLADRRAKDRFELLRRMREVALAQPGVTEALYRRPNPIDGGKSNTVARFHPDWHSDGPRTGDLFVLGDPGVGFGEPAPESNPLPGNHGAPQTADNFLAVTGGSDLVRQRIVDGPGRASNPVNVDIAPTVMGLFGLFAPEDSRGRFLRKAFDRGELRRVARPHRPELRVRGGRVAIAPPGGEYDVEAGAGGDWTPVATATQRSRIKLGRLPDGASALRARLLSAAGVAGPWARIAIR
jgi:hypothetical protein